MTQLFAAVDHSGAIRFADEVPRGSACGCFCPVCSSPLVAKQGEQLQWHFAHEAGQERPDCEVGAANLVHRIAVDTLRAEGALTLPPYHLTVRVGFSQEDVSWKSNFVPESLQWVSNPTKTAPVARGLLDNDARASLYVSISATPPDRLVTASEGEAVIVYWFPMPTPRDMASLASVQLHIRTTGRLTWVHQPDTYGLIARSRKRMEQQLQDEQQQKARQAGMRWAGIANRMREQQTPTPQAIVMPSQQPAPASAFVDTVYDWAPNRKSRSAFVFYRLRDGTAWVVYTQKDNSTWIVPWPVFDGWDECLPPSVGVADPGASMYHAPAVVPVLMFMSRQSACTRTSTNPADFQGL